MSYTTYPGLWTINISSGPLTALIAYGNSITGGIVSPFILIATFYVSMLFFSNSPFKEKAFVASTFFTFFISALLLGAGVLNPFFFFGSMLLFAYAAWNASRWQAG